MARNGKNHAKTLQLIEEDKAYSLEEAIELAKRAAYAKFDETVELHLRTNLDPQHADQQVRGTATMPHGLGKKIRVLVFTQGEGVRTAQEAGADYTGSDDLIQQIEGGWLEFDIALATPDMMSKISKLGRILGRKGLMPNPKSGTIAAANDLPRLIKEANLGRLEFRLDRTGIIHVPVGKISFTTPQLLENITSLIEAVIRAKPSGIKGQYIRSTYLSTTMGPGIKLDMSAAAVTAK